MVINMDNGYGKRYRDYKNIIWINGGDRDGGGENKPVWDAIAGGHKISRQVII